MRIFNALIYEERNEGTPPRYSNPGFDDLLGAADQLSLLVVADQVQGSGFGYDLLLEESADKVLWIAKNGLRNGTSDVADLHRELDQNKVDARVFRDAGTRPSLAFLRVRVTLTGSAGMARIRIWATGRAFGLRALKASRPGGATEAPWR